MQSFDLEGEISDLDYNSPIFLNNTVTILREKCKPFMLPCGKLDPKIGLLHFGLGAKEVNEYSNEIASRLLLNVGRLFGQPYGYQLRDGELLVEDIFPLDGHERSNTSASSAVDLPYHADLEAMPTSSQGGRIEITSSDLICLYCLQSREPFAVTKYIHQDDLKMYLSKLDLETLSEKKFSINPMSSESSDVESRNKSTIAPFSIFEANSDGSRILVDFSSSIIGLTYSAQKGLDRLKNCLPRVESQCQVSLKRGDILIINNRQGLHSRTAFSVSRCRRQRRHLKRILIRN